MPCQDSLSAYVFFLISWRGRLRRRLDVEVVATWYFGGEGWSMDVLSFCLNVDCVFSCCNRKVFDRQQTRFILLLRDLRLRWSIDRNVQITWAATRPTTITRLNNNYLSSVYYSNRHMEVWLKCKNIILLLFLNNQIHLEQLQFESSSWSLVNSTPEHRMKLVLVIVLVLVAIVYPDRWLQISETLFRRWLGHHVIQECYAKSGRCEQTAREL